MEPDSNIDRRVKRKVKSEEFEDFLEDIGEDVSKWEYVMETWKREDGSTYERHYWSNGESNYYHK